MKLLTLANGQTLALIGDPHIGRKFETGVPLSRRGEREVHQFAQFLDELNVEADIVCVIGDLFDNAFVGYGVVDKVTRAVREVVEQNPDRLYVIIAGNHDLPRNVEAVGAFHDFLDRLELRYSNLRILLKPEVIGSVAYFPWEWDKRADDQARSIDFGGVEAAVGHWDLSLFEGKDTHLAPVSVVPAGVDMWSGHYHVAGEYKVGGRVVNCTGSLQPYTHGEDPDGVLYVTVTRDAALEGEWYDKNVRVLIRRGETLPDIEAMSVIGKIVDDEAPVVAEKVSLDTFNWNGILKSKLDPLDQRVQDFIYERLPNGRATE